MWPHSRKRKPFHKLFTWFNRQNKTFGVEPHALPTGWRRFDGANIGENDWDCSFEAFLGHVFYLGTKTVWSLSLLLESV